jgi:hypothetical protein
LYDNANVFLNKSYRKSFSLGGSLLNTVISYMTAEVAIMNRIGVALASDSAVTIGRDANKIYTSADKLFQLSASAPIGIMVYGNASFVNLPWETIVKSFRRDIGISNLLTVDEYATRLIDYISENRELIPEAIEERQIRNLILSLYFNIRENIRERIDEEAEQRNEISDSDLELIIVDVIETRLKFILSQDNIEIFDDNTRSRLQNCYKDRFIGLRSQVFGNLPLTSRGEEALIEIAVQALTREYFGPLKCGVVIAGFGEREYTPSLVSYEFEETLFGLPRYQASQRHKIGIESDACILPFAQQESVYQFLEGIDISLANFMKETTQRVIGGAIDLILEKIEAADNQMSNMLREAIVPEREKMLKGLFDEWESQGKKYWEPILGIVAILPKDELGAMAEALVNLTKFRRRVTPERETVGGPIDVALITKGDGFVWLRRKHYFDPELNPRVLARFSQEFDT